MPLYPYRCSACGHTFEELVGADRPDKVKCPACGGEAGRSWKSAGTFGVSVSAGRRECPAECAGSCGCEGRCGCAR